MEAFYKEYKPSWKSFYSTFFIMIALLVLAGALHFLKQGETWLKWVWIAVIVLDVLLYLCALIRRSTQTLIIRDNPAKSEDQEVSFIKRNPFKPFSSDFKKSIEIGLRNIIDIRVEQTALQDMLNIGSVIITSSGTGGAEITASNLPNPDAIRDEIQVRARKYKAE